MRHETTLGYICVDAGICMIGDPCYTLPDDGSHRDDVMKNWDKFCDALGDNYVVRFGDDGRLGSTAIVVGTGWGDGTYPVRAIMDNGRVMSVTIDFEGDEE